MEGEYSLKIKPNDTWRKASRCEITLSVEVEGQIRTFKGELTGRSITNMKVME